MKKNTILIVSGFLGAGKTTFIKKIIKESENKYKLMVIENDFGQVSFDADLLTRDGIRVRELTSGCICCSLVGDFQLALKDVLAHNDADLIIIEPSGVAKLSDIINVCIDPSIASKCFLLGSLTIVDAMKAPLYFNNFGEFFKDQIKYSNGVLLTHGEDIPSQTNKAIEIIHGISPNLPIHQEDWRKLDLLTDLSIDHCIENGLNLGKLPTWASLQDHEHAAPIFSSITIKPTDEYTEEQFNLKLNKLIDAFNILRIKGYIKSNNNTYLEIQYTPSNLEIKTCNYPNLEVALTIIGTNLRGGKLQRIWEEV